MGPSAVAAGRAGRPSTPSARGAPRRSVPRPGTTGRTEHLRQTPRPRGQAGPPGQGETEHQRKMRESGEQYDKWVDGVAESIDKLEAKVSGGSGKGGPGGGSGKGGSGGGGDGGGGDGKRFPGDNWEGGGGPVAAILPYVMGLFGAYLTYYAWNEYDNEMSIEFWTMFFGAGPGLILMRTAWMLYQAPSLVGYGTGFLFCFFIAAWAARRAYVTLWDTAPIAIAVNALVVAYLTSTVIYG